MNRRLACMLLVLAAVACAAQQSAELAAPPSEEAADAAPIHLGGCILLAPNENTPEDVYELGDVVPTGAIPPLTRELQVYGLKLAARDDISDDFMRLVARTIAEVFPQDAGLDLDMQREVLANHLRPGLGRRVGDPEPGGVEAEAAVDVRGLRRDGGSRHGRAERGDTRGGGPDAGGGTDRVGARANRFNTRE